MKRDQSFIAKFADSKLLTALLIITSISFLISNPALAAKKKSKAKKPTGTIVGPTGILGDYTPKWPKTPNEIQMAMNRSLPLVRSRLVRRACAGGTGAHGHAG